MNERRGKDPPPHPKPENKVIPVNQRTFEYVAACSAVRGNCLHFQICISPRGMADDICAVVSSPSGAERSLRVNKPFHIGAGKIYFGHITINDVVVGDK